MKKRVLSLALCLVLVVGLFSGLTVNASASRLDDLKKEIAEKLIKEKIEQLKEEFEIPDLDTEAIISSFTTAATEGDFGVNSCLHWKVTSTFTSKTLTITGSGAMPDFDFPNGNLAPWWNYEALGMNALSEIDFDIKGKLKTVIIGEGVTNVSNYALFFLPAATQVTLPESVTSIGRYGIAMCSKLTGLSIPKGVTGIGDFGLAGNGLTAITLPDGLQSLGRGAFDSCASLTNTTLPAAITAVPGKCFADCTKLLNVKYAGTVTAIGDLAFESCKALTAAPIPETVTEIGASAFTGCTALTDVTIPAGVSTIPEDCFRGCTALADIDLPSTVTSVGHNAFTDCTALKDVRCYGAAPAVEPGNSEAHSFEPATVTVHYNPAMNWTLDADGKWQGYTVSDKGACTHTDYDTTERTVPATCGEAGRVDTICSNCGEVISTRELPPTGAHDWGNGVVTTAPAETTPGVRTFTCTVCDQTRTEAIPATGAHDYRFTTTVAPTCTDGGYDLYTCSGCGATEKRNLTDAFLYACRGCGGVQIVFNGKVILGTRARKTCSKSFQAFSSVNYPDLAVVQDEHLLQYMRCACYPSPVFYDALDDKVGLLKLIPGTPAAVLEFMLDRFDGLVIESFGVGGLPEYEGDASYFDIIHRGIALGKLVVMTTQVPNEGSNLAVYHVGGRLKSALRLLEAYDMTTEAAVAKLMWIMGQTRDFDEAERLFYRPVARDILYEN